MKLFLLAGLFFLNIVAFYYGISPFFTEDHLIVLVPVCAPDDHGTVFGAGMNQAREILLPSLKWLVGIGILNFVAAAACLLHWRRGAAA